MSRKPWYGPILPTNRYVNMKIYAFITPSPVFTGMSMGIDGKRRHIHLSVVTMDMNLIPAVMG